LVLASTDRLWDVADLVLREKLKGGFSRPMTSNLKPLRKLTESIGLGTLL
jgi:hypothetical protein